MNVSIFTAEKILCIFLGHVFVMCKKATTKPAYKHYNAIQMTVQIAWCTCEISFKASLVSVSLFSIIMYDSPCTFTYSTGNAENSFPCMFTFAEGHNDI